MYPRTESNTPIHTGGSLIKSHFWLEIPLKLDHQTVQIKVLVCDSECPYDLILGWTSMAQLSTWQNYTSHKLYIQQSSLPLTVRNNIRVLPGISRPTITMPDIAYVSIFTDNDLTHITEDHFEIKLIARLLNQIYVVKPPMLPPRYDDAPPG